MQPYERAVLQNMMLPAGLARVVEMDLPSEVFPTEALRPVYEFMIDYWHEDGHEGPPSVEAVMLHHSNTLAEEQLDLTIEPDDSLAWGLQAMQGAFIQGKIQVWIRDFATGIMPTDNNDVLTAAPRLNAAIEDLMQLQSTFTTRSEQVDIRTAMQGQLDAYLARAASTEDHSIRGARFGMREIDDFIGGVRPSELAILAAPPKTGKSFALLWGAYMTWLAGGTPVLITLENSVEMTLERLACMVCEVDSRRWERGQCTPEEVAKVEAWIRDFLTDAERPLHIIQPEPGKRTMEQLIRRARSLGDSIWIDQLTFVEITKGDERRPRHEQIRSMLHDGKSLISTGVRLPLVIAHQINREGVAHARKQGYLLMEHLAEGSEVERTADYVFGLWQAIALREVGRAWWQMLAARRKDLMHWEIGWRPHVGEIGVRNPVRLPGTEAA
jgi:hypothetical protein